MARTTPIVGRVVSAAMAVKVLGGSGVLRPYGPRTVAELATVLRDWGLGPAGGFAAMAVRDPDAVGLVDDLGELTWGELHRRSNALARGLVERGVGEGSVVAVMCRNHRGFLDATAAIAKLGSDIVYLNTSFAAPQVAQVLELEGATLVVHDEEFTDQVADRVADGVADGGRPRLMAWTEGEPTGETLERLIASGDESDLAAPGRRARIVILTSGTTGTPKGAARNEAGIDAAVSLVSRMPLRAGWRTHIAAPLFHSWGLAHLGLAMLFGSTVVLRRAFDAETALRTVESERCEALAVVPAMLQSMLALDEALLDTIHPDGHPDRLRVVASSGSTLPPDLATRWMDRFGDNLYNVYGSTEVAYASVAMPADLRADAATAGKPPFGTVVKVLDDRGRELPTGCTGRIFVGNGLLFDGYTGGGSKEVVDGLMSSGDVGHFDASGRLFVEGRSDDMIVSGGENVFPQEVEDCLVTHPAVEDAACIGVADEEFGSRLLAFVVCSAETTQEQLRAHVRERLAGYKVPREVLFLDELPRNATGKVLRRRLAETVRP